MEHDVTARRIRVVHPSDRVKVIHGTGDEYRFLASGDDTEGGYFLVEAVVPPGGGPPFHILTKEEEAFYVLEGQLSSYGIDGEIVAGPGTYLNIPKGAKHRFRNNGDATARMLFFFTPAGIEGLFDELGRMEKPSGEYASAIRSLNLLGEKYGVEYLAE